jgi:hypothetical protein
MINNLDSDILRLQKPAKLPVRGQHINEDRQPRLAARFLDACSLQIPLPPAR